MGNSGVRAALLALVAVVAIAFAGGRQATADSNREFVYLYDDDGFLIGGSLDDNGRFTNTFISGDFPGQLLDQSSGSYDTQSVSFSPRFHQVVVGTGNSITTALVGPLTGFMVPGTSPVVTEVPGALLLHSLDVVDTSSGSFVYASDYADLLETRGQSVDPHPSNLFAFRMRADGTLTALPVPSYPLGGIHAVGIAHLGTILVVGIAIETEGGFVRHLKPFRINRDGSLTPVAAPVPAGVTFPTLRAAMMPAATVYAADCGGNGGVSAFHLNPATGALTPLPGSPYSTEDALPCTLAVRRGTVIVGGSDPETALTTFRADASGVLHPVRVQPSPLGDVGLLAYADDRHLVSAGSTVGPSEGLLLIRSWLVNPASRRLTAGRLLPAGPGGVKSFAGVFSRTSGALANGQVTNLGGLLDYAVGDAGWFVRGMTVWRP